MSGRRRRSETSWEKKEESKSEANDGVMSSDFSGRPSWEPLQGNGNMPMDDAINRDRHIDEWEKPYSTHHSNDSYGALPYRGRDRGVGGSGSMSRDRDRTRSRSRDRGRGGARGVSRSRSRGRDRDRGRDWGSTRARSRSPFRDERQESYEYGVVDQKVGQKVDRKLTESWSRRPDYPGGYNRNSADRSRNRGSDNHKEDSGLDKDTRDIAKEAYPCKDFMRGRCHRGASCRFPHHGASGDDYHRDGRNVYDDQDRRRQLSRNSRAPPCKFFSVGKCNRDDCKFSHDGPESGRYDRRSHENFRGHNLGNKNRTWNDGEPQDDLNASDFSDFAKSNHNFGDKKSWNGPSWDNVESGPFDKSSRDNVQDHTSDDKNRTWDGRVPDSDDKKKSWDGLSWDDVNASGFSNVRKSNPNLDNKKRPWNGPSWDEVSASGLSNVPKPCHNSEDDKKGTMGGASGFSYGAKSTNNIDGKTKSWNGPLWGEASASGYADVGKSHVGDGMLQTDSKIRNWDGPGWNENTSEKNDYLMPQSTSVTNGTDTLDAIVINDSHAKAVNMVSGKDSVHSVHNMSSQSLSHLSGTEQSHHTLSSNPFNGSKSQLNGPVQGMFLHRDSHKQTEIQNKEGGRPLGPREVDVPQVMNNMNETSVISEQVPQLNGLPASLPEISQKAQLPQAYTELNLANTIGFLNSLPNSASSVPCIDPMVFQHSQDTRPKEQYSSARNMEVSMSVKSSVPMGILSGSARQENQMPAERFPPLSIGGPNSSKLSGIGVVEKEYGKSPKTKKQEPVGNPEGTESKVAENAKQEQENINPDNSEAQGKAEEGNISNDEKAMRQFKTALVEFVKETLKPTWKEGKMSREVHKTIVKKVVDKVSSSIQGIQIPGTQAKIEQYLAFSKSKITKLVEAYVEKFLKA